MYMIVVELSGLSLMASPGLLLGNNLLVAVVTALGLLRELRDRCSFLDIVHMARRSSFLLMLLFFLLFLFLFFSLWFAGLWLREGSQLLMDGLQLYQEKNTELSKGKRGLDEYLKTTIAGHRPAPVALPASGLSPLQSHLWKTQTQTMSHWNYPMRR